MCDGRLILISLALYILAVENEDHKVSTHIEECLFRQVWADYDRSNFFVGIAGFKEKAAILDSLKIKDMDSDDLLDHVRVHYGIEDTALFCPSNRVTQHPHKSHPAYTKKLGL